MSNRPRSSGGQVRVLELRDGRQLALFTPVIISLLVSLARPVFFHRFLIICLPAWLLAVAVGRARPGHRRERSAIAGVCVLSLVSTVISYTRVREDWRGVANYLIEHAADAGPSAVLRRRRQLRARAIATGCREERQPAPSVEVSPHRAIGWRRSREPDGCGSYVIPRTGATMPTSHDSRGRIASATSRGRSQRRSFELSPVTEYVSDRISGDADEDQRGSPARCAWSALRAARVRGRSRRPGRRSGCGQDRPACRAGVQDAGGAGRS